MNVLFVCTGNINRSPAAATIFKKLYPEHSVDSAAISDFNKGKLTTKKTREELAKRGYEYVEIKSKPLKVSNVDWSDVIFFCQPSHLKSLKNLFGESTKYISLAALGGLKGITDPAFNGKFVQMMDELELCLKALKL